MCPAKLKKIICNDILGDDNYDDSGDTKNNEEINSDDMDEKIDSEIASLPEGVRDKVFLCQQHDRRASRADDEVVPPGKSCFLCNIFGNPNSRPRTVFVCGYCNARYKKRSNLRKHQQMHAEDAHFSCSICNKRFIKYEQLKKHYSVVHESTSSAETKDDDATSVPSSSKT